MAAQRLIDNKEETKHPLHHKTTSGVIVEPDPTLEYYLTRLASVPAYKDKVREMREEVSRYETVTSGIPQAMPVNRKYYGYDPFERH